MSFKDRLERLHDSRRRQKKRARQSESDTGSGENVFYADEVDETSTEGKPSDTSDASSQRERVQRSNSDVSRETSGAEDVPGERTRRQGDEKGDVYSRLERSYEMKRQSRTAPSRGAVKESAARDGQSETSSAECRLKDELKDDDLGGWIASLRRKAESALQEGNWERAASQLFEIVALSPNHPYALSKLAEYHERRGESAAARRYRERLDRESPFGE